ncbi:hypothetical protein GCM10017566_38510 [Amycolatopsis bartoniae]|uniref:Uncharacterized protein n=1 Tax=Amycolatopsis bartoniae TaxID=941986 RepID=A0A8H9J1N1_9PSEU|nr:hypothetical protein GCM10017566_38510 [Amycolatopsis bartoniae]
MRAPGIGRVFTVARARAHSAGCAGRAAVLRDVSLIYRKQSRLREAYEKSKTLAVPAFAAQRFW